MKQTRFLVIPFLIGMLLIGCSEGKADMEGIIIEVNPKTILMAENLGFDKYEEIKNTSSDIKASVEKEIRDTETDIRLIDVAYDNPGDFKAGNEVKVWIDGGIRESFPAQANAEKILLKD